MANPPLRSDPRILITICARGGSKGIPGKNIRPLAGVPLIGYSVRHAEAFARKHGADIALSTDSDEIRAVAARLGLSTDYVRPMVLATDAAGKTPVFQHVLEWEEKRRGVTYDALLDLDVSGPMRTQEDLEAAYQIFCSDPHCLILFSVHRARRNPYFNMLEQGSDGYYKICKPGKTVLSRQSAPRVYDMSGSFYFFRRAYFRTNPQMTDSARSLIYEMPHPCFDIDELVDFEFLEYLLKENKLGFAL